MREATGINEVRVAFLGNGRIKVETCNEVASYVAEHAVYVETELGNKTRMGQAGFNKKGRKDPKFDETIISLERFPAFARQYLRVKDQLKGGRTVDSLATEAQLARVRQFYKILSKRVDNVMLEPVELDQFTHGEIGRLRSDLEAVLVKEGLWDSENKVETEKSKQLRKRK